MINWQVKKGKIETSIIQIRNFHMGEIYFGKKRVFKCCCDTFGEVLVKQKHFFESLLERKKVGRSKRKSN